MIIAGCQDSFADSKWDILKIWSVQLFNCSIESIAVNVYDRLREVAAEFEGGNVVIRSSEVMFEVQLLELAFAGEDPVDLLGQGLVFSFLVAEELATFGDIVDDFGNLWMYELLSNHRPR
jgi:hypothetical protein